MIENEEDNNLEQTSETTNLNGKDYNSDDNNIMKDKVIPVTSVLQNIDEEECATKKILLNNIEYEPDEVLSMKLSRHMTNYNKKWKIKYMKQSLN